MTSASLSSPATGAAAGPSAVLSPRLAQGLVLAVTLFAAVAGFQMTGPAETARAAARCGPELSNLLRAMTGIKAVMAAGVLTGVIWRLGHGAGPCWLAAYGLACASMSLGVGLIWDLAHLKLGALALHAGLIASLVLLWRDPVLGRRMAEVISARRAALRARG